jgi:hypothetical protein
LSQKAGGAIFHDFPDDAVTRRDAAFFVSGVTEISNIIIMDRWIKEGSLE